MIIGTPAYMSPEQAKGSKLVNERSDVYSLGLVAFEMLTGKQPYEADTPMGKAVAHIVNEVPNICDYRDDLGQEFRVLFETVLAKDPNNRFATAKDFAKFLENVIKGETVILPKLDVQQFDPDCKIIEPIPFINSDDGNSIDKLPKTVKLSKNEPKGAFSVKRLDWIFGILVVAIIVFFGFQQFGGKPPDNEQIENEPTFAYEVIGDIDPLNDQEAENVTEEPSKVAITSTPDLEIGYSIVLTSNGYITHELPGTDPIEVTEGMKLPPGQGSLIKTANGTAQIKIPDGSIIYIEENSLIEFREVADVRDSQRKVTTLVIFYGGLVSHVNLDIGYEFYVVNEIGARAQVIGSMMGVFYDPGADQHFHVDCIEGHCVLNGTEYDDHITIIGGVCAELWANLPPEDCGQSNNDYWRALLIQFEMAGLLPIQITATSLTNTPIPQTSTPKPPTNTPIPPTNTPKPPTNTPIPPTKTPIPPTNTPKSPTNTPVPTSVPWSCSGQLGVKLVSNGNVKWLTSSALNLGSVWINDPPNLNITVFGPYQAKPYDDSNCSGWGHGTLTESNNDSGRNFGSNVSSVCIHLLTFAPLALQYNHINKPPKAMTEKSSLAEADRDARAVD
jgi:hypothetical protein